MPSLKPIAVAGLIAILMFPGCTSQSSPGQAAQKPDSSDPATASAMDNPPSTTKPAAAPSSAYHGPPATVRVVMLKTNPVQYQVTAEVTAPTGGWKLTLDKTEILDGVANLYLTLEKPGKDELVTQSLVTLNAGHKTATPVTRAQAHIFVAERGVSYFTASYQLAAASTP